MTVELVKEFANYGLLGLVLLMLGAGVFLAARWYAREILKPNAVVNLETQRKQQEVLAALGLTLADTHRGVGVLLGGHELVENEFAMLRNHVRVCGDALIAVSTLDTIAAPVRDRLEELGGRMVRMADDASKEHRALTEEDMRNARNRPKP